ncbi:GNAT family N-acetyltransferase [Noviherbaspirillum autotrophicum]|uniref:GNAT family N-acetyltransferase n=1 Tax=Noviherbaspirillum autotrophicum TaxID=709839 RepID=UPI000693C0C0|nr:GNAT family N-acetyltransferase [Noviherbaspirillum autotrophicum]
MKTAGSTLPLSRRPPRNEHSLRVEQVQIDCHENEVPAFAAAEIDRLYGHLYCSPRYFEAASAMAAASCYVASSDGHAIAVLPYRRTRDEVTVVSEYLTLDAAEIERFCRHMFSRYPGVKRVTFPKLHANVDTLALPRHAMVCSEDMVVPLPPSVKDYENAVGKNMRRNIKRYSSALSKAFPSYRYELYLERDISEQDVRDIIALSCMRMKSKNIVPRFDDTEIDWIAAFAKTSGIVGLARIDGKVCAGAIGFRIGDSYFMHVIAHHPQYNDYSLGILCYYHTICEGIARGGKRFHLLQGRYGYKYRLLAERRDILHLDVYRSRVAALASLAHIARKEAKGRIWLAKQWLLHDLEHKEGRGYRLLARAVDFLRRAKRSKGATD